MYNLPLLSPLLDQSICLSAGEMKYINDTFSSDSFWNCFFHQNDHQSDSNSIDASHNESQLDSTTDSISNAKSFKSLLQSLHGRMQLMEDSICYLKTEIEHKNSTIDQLIKVVNKLTPCAEGNSTYNIKVDEYNKNVSKFNSTPQNTENVTTRKKKSGLPTDLAEYEFEEFCREENSCSSTKDDDEFRVPYADQLAEYRKSKHHNFLSANEGRIWDGSAWKNLENVSLSSPEPNTLTNDVTSIHDVSLDDEND